MKYVVGQEYDICVQQMYDDFGENLSGGLSIRKDGGDEAGGNDYYDLVDKSGDIVCMDGETARLISIDGGFLLFENSEGEDNKRFTLSEEEADSATGTCPVQESRRTIAAFRKTLHESRFDLRPQYDSRKSFGGKAQVDTGDGSDNKLYSYGTLVAEMQDGKPVLHSAWNFSSTTVRHVKEWLKQNGFPAGTTAEIADKYEVAD